MFSKLVTLLSSLIILLHSASHEFLAEQHFICNTCKSISNKLKSNANVQNHETKEYCKQPNGEIFTSLCDEILEHTETITSLTLNGKTEANICESLQYCDFETSTDYTSLPAIDTDVIELINNLDTTWKAGKNAMFETATLHDVRKRLGTIIDPEYSMTPTRMVSYDISDYDDLPSTFDVRENWPECAIVSGTVRDQSDCGSCWSFGSTEALNDRYCIHSIDNSDEIFTQLLSTEDTMTCCEGKACSYSEGCDGGFPGAAWEWFVSTGVVSGGLYSDIGNDDTCSPYLFPGCWHHEPSPSSANLEKCAEDEYETPKCKHKCSNTDYPIAFANDKHYSGSAYYIDGNCTDCNRNIMIELYNYGSVTASFIVYEDFEYYESGIYQHVYGSELGGHSIKIIGWGTENNVDYWLCMNSWNEYWGDNGLFKILRGVDECGIESEVYAGRMDESDKNGFIYSKDELTKMYRQENLKEFHGIGKFLTELGFCFAIGFLVAGIYIIWKKLDCKRHMQFFYTENESEMETLL